MKLIKNIRLSFIFNCFMLGIILVFILTGCTSMPETVELRYAAWNLGSENDNGLERQMVQQFMKENPSLKVDIDENFVNNYDSAMNKAADNQSIPDVFMYSGNSEVEANNWCLDLADIIKTDEEWGNIPKVLRDSVYVKGKMIAIPSAMYFYGYFCNNQILKESGVGSIQPGLPVDAFIKMVKKTTNIDAGKIGLSDSSSICNWYPAAVNSRFGWFTWDGGKFNLDSSEFKDSIKLTSYLNTNNYSYTQLNDKGKEILQPNIGNNLEAWTAGSVAFKFDGTWSVSNYSMLPFDISFIGMPGGRPCIVPDYLFISKTSKHPLEAYKFAKFMSAYSDIGFLKRLELAKKNNLIVTTLPMTNNAKIIEKYFSLMKVKGIEEIYNKIHDNAYIEETKVLPGYIMARWNYETNITAGSINNAKIGEVINGACYGYVNIDEVALDLNYLANTCIKIYPQQLNN